MILKMFKTRRKVDSSSNSPSFIFRNVINSSILLFFLYGIGILSFVNIIEAQTILVNGNEEITNEIDVPNLINSTKLNSSFYYTHSDYKPFKMYGSNLSLEEMTKLLAEETLRNDTVTETSFRSLDGRSYKLAPPYHATSGFSSLISRFSRALDLNRVVREIETSVMTSVSCTACRAGAGLLFHYLKTGRTNEEIAYAAIKLCINFKMQTPRVCNGIINNYVSEVVMILRSIVLNSYDICALVIGESCGKANIPPSLSWEVSFPPIPKPAVEPFPSSLTNSSTKLLKIVQISDTHWDPHYEPGSNAVCDEPLCCRLSSGPVPHPRSNAGAGLWGDYRKCDTPRHTMEAMFKHISETHKDIDLIYWTGDIPAHDIWNQSHSSNIDILKSTVNMFFQYFPNTPVYPALGNHEGAPVNSFPPPWVKNPQFSIDWLYNELEYEWSRWLPQDTMKTIRNGAYYSTMIKPGFKLISINTNYCNNKNWWLLINSTDPTDELKWLIFELQSSEFAGEKVHIIGHIPPGHSDCMKIWSQNYYSIISRYESTISAQFFGHTHFDELEIFYPDFDEPHSEDIFRPGNIAYVGPSVTPYFNLNPGYRVYYVDPGRSKVVLDHDTWVTDLGDANKRRLRNLEWYKLYSAKEAFGMSSLSPENWDDLVMRMYKDKQLFSLYYRFYNKNSPVAEECDDACRLRLLCDIRSGKSHSREELCKPRTNHPYHRRLSFSPEKQQASKGGSIGGKIMTSLSSAFSTLYGIISYPFFAIG